MALNNTGTELETSPTATENGFLVNGTQTRRSEVEFCGSGKPLSGCQRHVPVCLFSEILFDVRIRLRHEVRTR